MATRACASSLRLLAIWTAILLPRSQVKAHEPFETLQTYPLYNSSEGKFKWPSGTTAVFDEGSSMTVTWGTDFDSINLYVVYNQTVGEGIQFQTQLASEYRLNPAQNVPAYTFVFTAGYRERSYEWEVECDPDCRAPFSFHAVNARGTEEEQLIYGFWTRPFWIKPAESSTVSASTASASLSVSSGLVTASSIATTPVAEATASPSAAAPSAAPKIASKENGQQDSGHYTTTGVGVGAGVGVILLVATAALFWQRYHRRMKEKYSQPPPTHLQTSWQQPPAYHYAQSTAVLQEAKAMSPAEAPSWQMVPQELGGRSP